MPHPLTLLEPFTRADAAPASRALPLPSLQGAVIGFIDNAKPNFDRLAERLANRLVATHGVARTVTVRKRAASIAADGAMIARLAAECDLVIAGSGD
jgi:hypothetical protein